MRESGFDPSNRFGPFSVDIIHYDPVCLNSLLYLMEQQTAELFDILDKEAEGSAWRIAGNQACRGHQQTHVGRWRWPLLRLQLRA